MPLENELFVMAGAVTRVLGSAVGTFEVDVVSEMSERARVFMRLACE